MYSKDIKLGKRNYCPIIISVLSIIVFTITLASFSNSAYAETINVDLDSGISLRILDADGKTDLPELGFGLTPSDSGVSVTKNAIAEVGTSNETGYSLYMYSDYNDNNDDKTTSLVDNSTGSVIPTNLAVSFPYWYYYNNYSSANKTIPAYGSPDQLAKTSVASDSSKTTVPITVGVDTSVTPGVYRNKLVFTAVGNPLVIDYTVSFSANNSGSASASTTGTVTRMPTSSLTRSSTASSVTFTLPSNRPYNNGTKVFLGWSENANGSGTIYKPGASYTDVAQTTSGADNKTLYAIWGAAAFWNIYYMQEMTTSVCSGATTPLKTAGTTTATLDTTGAHAGDTAYVAQRTLYDIRDNKAYTIRKLADGNCWMATNLAYDMSSGAGVGSKNDRSTFTFNMSTNAQGMNNTMNVNGKWYYSWPAATAAIGTQLAPYTTDKAEVDGSICPAGWQLPHNYSVVRAKSWGGLLYSYGIAATNHSSTVQYKTMEALPLELERSGYVDGNALSTGAASTGNGYYWSSTAKNTNDAYSLRFSDSLVNPQNTDSGSFGRKRGGFSVRCLAI